MFAAVQIADLVFHPTGRRISRKTRELVEGLESARLTCALHVLDQTFPHDLVVRSITIALSVRHLPESAANS